MNQHFIDSENARYDVANNNKVNLFKNATIGHLPVLTSDVDPTHGNVYITSADRSASVNGIHPFGREAQPKGRYSNIEEGLESSVGNEAKERINRIVGDVKSLSDVEKLLLYLRLPTGDTSKDLRQTPTSCLQTSNRTEQAQAYTWIRSHLEEDIEICLPKQEVYEDYRVYCENHGIRPLSTADFGKLMKCVFPNVKPRRLGQRGQSRYCYGGLRKKLDIEAPGLPALEINPHKQQDAGSEDDELFSASCQLVCEWAQKLLDQTFPSVRELAEHLVSHLYVNSKSVSAFTVVAGMQDSGIQNMKVSSMFSNTTGGDRHRETQLQLQRKLHEREQLREYKKKLQMQKEENEQKAKEAQDRMTPSLTSPTLLRALSSPARRIFDKKEEEIGGKCQESFIRSQSVLNGSTTKSKSSAVELARSVSSVESEKTYKKQENICQDMDVDMSRLPSKYEAHSDNMNVYAMEISHLEPVQLMPTMITVPKSNNATAQNEIFTKMKLSRDQTGSHCEVRRESWSISLMERVKSASCEQSNRERWNLEEESATRAFHTIMKPSVLSQHRTHPSNQDVNVVTVADNISREVIPAEESREISMSPDSFNSKISDNSSDCETQESPKPCEIDTIENLGKSEELLHLSPSSVPSSVSSSVSSRSAFVPFSQMGTRKENDMVSVRIPSMTPNHISTVLPSESSDINQVTFVSSSDHQSNFSGSQQPNISPNAAQFPSILSNESQSIISLNGVPKPPGNLSLNLDSPGSLNISCPTSTTVGHLGAMSTTSDTTTSQSLPQTSPSTPKKKSRFTPIRPKASPSKTVSTILKEKTSTDNSIYDKSKPVSTLLKEKRAREAEVLAQMKGGVTLSPGAMNPPNANVQIQNIQNITSSTLPKSLDLPKSGEFFIILNPTMSAKPASKMSMVSPVSTGTQSFVSNTASTTTSSRGKPDLSRGQRSGNPSRSRTNSSSESEIESIFPMGKEIVAFASDSTDDNCTEFNMDETPSKLVKIDSDQGVSSRPGSRCSVDRETPSFGRKRKFYTCGNMAYHKRINSADDTDDEVIIIYPKETGNDPRRAKSCTIDQDDQDETSSVNKENLNNTIDSMHCPDISILEIDALSDSGLDSDQLQLLSDPSTSKSATQMQSAAVGVNSLLLRHSQRELLKQKEVLDERMKSYWNKEGKINVSRKSDVVNMEVHGELPQDVADFITDALTGIANTNINENEDMQRATYSISELDAQHCHSGFGNTVPRWHGSGTSATGIKNFLQPISSSPMTAMIKPQRRRESASDCGVEKGPNMDLSATKNSTTTNFVSPQRPARRQRTPSVERLLGPTVTSDRHVHLQSPLDRGFINHSERVAQYISEHATTPSSFPSPVHPVMQRKRELSVDRISNQTPFSDAGYGSIGASPILTSTPVSSLGICDTTLNSTASTGLLMSRPDSVQSLASDTVMQSPISPFSPRNYTSTPLSIRSPSQNGNPLPSPVSSTGPPTRAFMPIQSSSTQKLETTVTLIKPTVTMASGCSSEGKEIMKDLIGIGSIQPDMRQIRPPPSYKAAVQSLNSLQAESMETSGAFNRPPSGPIDFPMVDMMTNTKSHTVMDGTAKGKEILPEVNLAGSGRKAPSQPDKTIADAYPCSFQLALMSQKSREDGKESKPSTAVYNSRQQGIRTVSNGSMAVCQPSPTGQKRTVQYAEPMVLGRPTSQQANTDYRIVGFDSGQVMSTMVYRSNSQQHDVSTKDLLSQEMQEFRPKCVSEQNSKERDIESILSILKNPNQHPAHVPPDDGNRRMMVKPSALPNANYKGTAPNVKFVNSHIVENPVYTMDKVLSSVVVDDVEFSARRNLMPDLMEEPSTEINEEELMSTLEDLRSVDEKYFIQDDFNSKRL